MASEHEQRRAISRDQVPFLPVIQAAGLLSDTSAKFLQWEAKADALSRINAEMAELERERPALDELRENARQSHDRYYQRAVGRMTKFISAGAMNPDYFSRLERAAVDKQLVLVPWSLCEDALAALEAGGYAGLPAAEKQKELAGLEKKRKKLVDEMEQLLPAAQFTRNDPQSGALINAAAAFFDSWRQIQVYTTDLCDYRGIALHLADDEIQRAHAVLGLSALRSRSAKVCAYVPPKTVA